MTTVAQAERDARQALDGWWSTPAEDSPLPVDPFELARRFGITVNYEFLPADESGNIDITPESAVITLNIADHANRQRFTCAHEIGHYVRRRSSGQSGRYIDYRSTLAGLGVDQEEVYANQFAAALLMPAHLVKRWHDLGETDDRLARRFGTSVQAMELRLRNLRLV